MPFRLNSFASKSIYFHVCDCVTLCVCVCTVDRISKFTALFRRQPSKNYEIFIFVRMDISVECEWFSPFRIPSTCDSLAFIFVPHVCCTLQAPHTHTQHTLSLVNFKLISPNEKKKKNKRKWKTSDGRRRRIRHPNRNKMVLMRSLGVRQCYCAASFSPNAGSIFIECSMMMMYMSMMHRAFLFFISLIYGVFDAHHKLARTHTSTNLLAFGWNYFRLHSAVPSVACLF